MKKMYEKPQMKTVWIGLDEHTMQNVGGWDNTSDPYSGPGSNWVHEEMAWDDEEEEEGSNVYGGNLWPSGRRNLWENVW